MSRFALIGLLFLFGGAAPPAGVVAEVNGRPLLERDLRAFLVLRGAPETVSESFRSRARIELVDRELIRQYLDRLKTVPDPAQLDAAVRAALERVATRTGDATTVLASLGLDEKSLRAELSVSVAWRHHVHRVLTEREIRDHFDANRRRLDGTRLRLSQVFLKYEAGESASNAPKTSQRLRSIRDEIAAEGLTFAEAAKRHSQAPSGARGGDLGWITPRGDLPAVVARTAYGLERDQISDVVLSPFGAHLLMVTDLKAGESSREDVRPTIVEELSRSLWDRTVADERKSAKIVIHEQIEPSASPRATPAGPIDEDPF